MVTSEQTEKRIVNKDLRYISILLAIGLIIGFYLIVTTVLISKDGTFYIKEAQRLQTDPIKVIKYHPPGYPFLILMAHKLSSLFVNSTSNQSWVYSAQSVTLLCRLLALIPLYFIGKLLVGAKNSFWAIFVLTLLPHSAKYFGEVLREWPYILFLSMGFFFLLWGAKCRKWWLFGLAGLSSGLGYLIRPESQQLIVYGFLWLTLCMLCPKLCHMRRWKSLSALALLLIGFAIPTLPYMKCTGKYFSPQARYFITALFSSNNLPNKSNIPKDKIVTPDLNDDSAETVLSSFWEALYKIFQTIGEHLMWFFVLPLFLGFGHWLFVKSKFEEQFLLTVFILGNVAMMVLQHCYNSPGVSRRWSLPLICVMICHVPVGLQIWGNWLRDRFSRSQEEKERNPQLWFFILLVVGVIICLPKLLAPIGSHKAGYKEAAKWLNENTSENAVVAVSDRRIPFYAEREGLIYDGKVVEGAKYVVAIVKKGEQPNFNMTVQEKFSTWVNKQKKKKKVIIYEIL